MGFLSSIFGKKENPLDEAFRAVGRLIEDEDYQNSLMNDVIQTVVLNGESVDKIPGATGDFGFDKNNPIPVNGSIGELAYLSHLETNQGEKFLAYLFLEFIPPSTNKISTRRISRRFTKTVQWLY